MRPDSELIPFFRCQMVNDQSISLSNQIFNPAVRNVGIKSDTEPMLLVHMTCGKCTESSTGSSVNKIPLRLI